MALPDTILETVKSGLGITGVTEDTRLLVLIDSCWAAIVQHCGRDFIQRTYPGAGAASSGDSGYYRGNGRRELLLRQRPVTAMTSVYERQTGYWGDNPDGTFDSSNLLVLGTDYDLDWDGCLPGTTTRCSYSGRLIRLNSTWANLSTYRPGMITPEPFLGLGNIKVAYTAGFTAPTVPADIKLALTKLVAQERRTLDKGGNVQSESWEDYSYSMAAPLPTPDIGSVRSLLAKHRSIPI
jgi:hypothetical protein